MEEERRQTGLKSAAAESRLSRYYLKRIMTLENVHRGGGVLFAVCGPSHDMSGR